MDKKPLRTIVYIDGFNLYYGQLKGTPYKWLDPVALFQRVLGPQNQITQIKYRCSVARYRTAHYDPLTFLATAHPAACQSMPKEIIHTVQVEFGDCDPARIVWFPNFFRWIDAASRNFFVRCGVPLWHELEKTHGVHGTPIVDTKASFKNTASYGDVLEIHTSVPEWRTKSFVQRYRVMRGDTPIMECEEVRIFAAWRNDGKPGIRAVPVPADIRALCE